MEIRRLRVVADATKADAPAPCLKGHDAVISASRFVTSDAATRFLERLKEERDLDWTFLSASADVAPGKRTGLFRLGTDQLLIDEAGRSHISMEDFAIAMADELERPAHNRQRSTVGY